MDAYVFPGHPAFTARAAEALGFDIADAAGRPLPPIIDLTNLCAQAATADLEHVEAILRQAETFHRRLRIAVEAAALMLADVRNARMPASSTFETSVEPSARSKSLRNPNRANPRRS